VIATSVLPRISQFGLQSSPGMSAAAQGQSRHATGKLPPGVKSGAGQSSIIVDMELGDFERELAANQEDLDPRISRLVDQHFWDLF